MSSSNEMGGFIFSVVFIVIFASLLSTVPAGLQGTGSSASNVYPVDPSLTTDFTDGENYTKSDFSVIVGGFQYAYSLGSDQWLCTKIGENFLLASKIIWWIFWFGQTDPVKFVSKSGTDRGTTLTLTEIESDSNDGVSQYTITKSISGDSAGGFIVYWNATLYSDPSDAWDNDVLYLIHGVDFTTTATNDIGSLLVGLLFLQLPDVPPLINLFIAVPIWACIIYVLWYVIKEMIPFV